MEFRTEWEECGVGRKVVVVGGFGMRRGLDGSFRFEEGGGGDAEMWRSKKEEMTIKIQNHTINQYHAIDIFTFSLIML